MLVSGLHGRLVEERHRALEQPPEHLGVQGLGSVQADDLAAMGGRVGQ